ncbi:DUF2318 domain-containing protein [Desulfococcaceae bacterium HSG8]|nr:DUF2318 domain-containing protein [Desulfococcaceae bacterium HSG8]
MKMYKKNKSLFKDVFVILIAFVCLISVPGSAGAWNFTIPAQEIQPADGVFSFPVSDFSDGKARYFVYKSPQDQKFRFFIVKSADGLVRAAFDACDVCFPGKKGYVQQGDQMVCVKCGLKFRTDRINEVKGGCNPAPLNRAVSDGYVVITEQDVLSGLKYFK